MVSFGTSSHLDVFGDYHQGRMSLEGPWPDFDMVAQCYVLIAFGVIGLPSGLLTRKTPLGPEGRCATGMHTWAKYVLETYGLLAFVAAPLMCL